MRHNKDQISDMEKRYEEWSSMCHKEINIFILWRSIQETGNNTRISKVILKELKWKNNWNTNIPTRITKKF